MYKKIIQITTLLIGSAFFTANAASISFGPSTQNIGAGNIAQVDVIVNGLESGGLDEIVAAYDLSVSFDSSILNFNSLSVDENQFDFGLGVPPLEHSFDSSVAGEVSFNLLSWEFDFDLQLFQGDSLTLATLAFNTVGTGSSALNFSFIDITGLNFSPLLLDTIQSGNVTVTGATNVPEPSVIILLSMGVLGIFGFNQKKVKSLG